MKQNKEEIYVPYGYALDELMETDDSVSLQARWSWDKSEAKLAYDKLTPQRKL